MTTRILQQRLLQQTLFRSRSCYPTAASATLTWSTESPSWGVMNSRRWVQSTTPPKVPENKDNDDDDEDNGECPEWQNPLHHNDPKNQKVYLSDFEPGEEIPYVPIPPLATENDESKVLAPPHLHELANEIVHMNMLEMNELVNKIANHFGFDDSMMSSGGGGKSDSAAPAEEAVVVEKIIFDLKLEAFDDKAKIKVIKEVRAITGLGLKEAKEMVEGAPKIIKKDIKKEEAEELKAKLEAAGATVSVV